MAYLRLYRERDEENHSPLQVEVSPVWGTPHGCYPVRSCALHPCAKGLGTALCASAAAAVVVLVLVLLMVPPSSSTSSSLPASVRPPSSPPQTPAEPLHRVQLREKP